MAKVRAQGADISLIGITESTYGTAPGSGYTVLHASSVDPGYTGPMGFEPELGTGPEATDPYYDPKQVAPSIEVHGRISELGFWLKHLLGAPTTTGTTIKTHVFSSGGELPSLSLERGHPSIATPFYELLTGFKLGTMDIDLARTGPMKAQFGGVAQDYGKDTDTIDDSATALGAGVFFNKTCGVKWNSTTVGSLVGGRLQFSNGLEAVETIRADQLIDGADETIRTCEGTVRIRTTSTQTLLDDALAETPRALQFDWTTPLDAGWGLTILMGRVFLEPASAPVNGPGGVEQEFRWRAAKPSGSALMVVTLKNDTASY